MRSQGSNVRVAPPSWSRRQPRGCEDPPGHPFGGEVVRREDNNRTMPLGVWQIIVTAIGIVVAPIIAAKLAVRNLQIERDHARLDELRNVLDEAAAQHGRLRASTDCR